MPTLLAVAAVSLTTSAESKAATRGLDPLRVYQHRGAPHGPGPEENTVVGALKSLADVDTDGLEIDVHLRNRVWFIGHEPTGNAILLATYLDAAVPTLLRHRKRLLVEIKDRELLPHEAQAIAHLFRRHQLDGLVTFVGFHPEAIESLGIAGEPVALFVERNKRKGRVAPEEAIDLVKKWKKQAAGPIDFRFVLRWKQGPWSDAVLARLERTSRTLGVDGNRVEVWFTGIGSKVVSEDNARRPQALFRRLHRIKREMKNREVLVPVTDEPGAVRKNAGHPRRPTHGDQVRAADAPSTAWGNSNQKD